MLFLLPNFITKIRFKDNIFNGIFTIFNDIQSENPQKRLNTIVFKNRTLAASDYVIVYTIN